MKSKNLLKKMAMIGLCIGTMSTMHAQNYAPSSNPTSATFTGSGTTATISQNFSTYGMTSNTGSDLPTGFFVSTENKTPFQQFHQGLTTLSGGILSSASGSYNPPDSDNFFGFWATGSGSDRALSMMEEGGGSGLGNARIYLKFDNNLGSAIQGARVSYRIQQWVNGNRNNEVRLRYDTGLSFSGADLASTQAKILTSASPSVAVDGLTNFEDTVVNVIFPSTLPSSSTGYFRWAFGTIGTTSGDRDMLGLTNVDIRPIFAGTQLTWNGSATWTDGAVFAAGPTNWTNTSSGAVLSSAGTINLGSDIVATNVRVTANTTISTSGNVLTVNGPIEVTSSSTLATVSGTVTGDFGVIKTGSGSLVLSNATVTGTGALAVQVGKLIIGPSVTLPTTTPSALTLGDTAIVTFSSPFNLSVNGIYGADTASINLGTSTTSTTLSMNVTGATTASYKGSLSGVIGTLVKDGIGAERFRTKPKTFTAAAVIVKDGLLELTQNTLASGRTLGNVSAVTVSGTAQVTATNTITLTQGVLMLSSDDTSTYSYTVGTSAAIPFILDGGRVAMDTKSNSSLLNNITVLTNDNLNRIDVSNNGGVVYTYSGNLSGASTATLRKVGGATLNLAGTSSTFSGTIDLNNGNLNVPTTNGAGTMFNNGTNSAMLSFTGSDAGNNRVLTFSNNATVSGLMGNSPDLPGTQTATLSLGVTTFTLNQPATVTGTPSEEIKPSYQGTIAGTGGFVKIGTGTTRFTRYSKNYNGTVTVSQGVLQVSNDGVFTGTNGITVTGNTWNATLSATLGGQVRLSSGGTLSAVVYTFGGPIRLASQGRLTDATITSEANYGILGGLRYDADAGTQLAVLASPVQITGAADIHINGTAVQKCLTISGALSGSSDFNRTGGGTMVLTNPSGFSGIMNLQNGVTVIGSNATFGGSINVSNATNSSTLGFNGAATISGDLAIDRGTSDNVVQVVAGATVAITGVLDISQPWTLDFKGTGTTGVTYTVFNSTGGVVTGTNPTVINGPSGSTTITITGNLVQVRFN